MRNLDETYVARMVDEPGSIPLHRRIYHKVIVNSEHVTSNPLVVIILFTIVGENCSDLLPSIFYDLNWNKNKNMKLLSSCWLTISPQAISRLQKRPLPWIPLAYTPTASRAFFARCLNLIAIGRSKLVALRLVPPIKCASAANSGGRMNPTLGWGFFLCLLANQLNISYSDFEW